MFRAIWKRIPKTPLYGLSVIGLAILILWGVMSAHEGCLAARDEEADARRVLADHYAQSDMDEAQQTRADTLRAIAQYVDYGYTPLQYSQHSDAAKRRLLENLRRTQFARHRRCAYVR